MSTVHYSLAWGDPNTHLYDVAVTFDAPADRSRLHLPAWRPGRYLIQNYAANVRSWSAVDESGNALRVVKSGKSTWEVDAAAGTRVSFRYQFFAGILDAGSSFLDAEEAYWNGSNLFVMVEGLRQAPATLDVRIPSWWTVETQLEQVSPHTFRARDYDHLIDSPSIAAGRFTNAVVEVSGARFHLVFPGEPGLDVEGLAKALAPVIEQQGALFGGFPFRDYRFLYHLGDKWHGVEHEDSCSILLKRSALAGAAPGDEGFDHFLSISSHELFHAWNVKRILPATFAPYDYSRETPTGLLWFFEGVTSYYGDLLLARSGAWTAERYFKHLAEEIEAIENAPARRNLSPEQAGRDMWLQEQNHDRGNSFLSFYTSGEILGALLDLTIRRATEGKSSLDDVVRLLWRDYGNGKRGVAEDGIREAVLEATGLDLGDWFDRHVSGTEPLPYADILDAAGLKFTSAAKSSDGAPLGGVVSRKDGLLFVDSVWQGGAAEAAGLLPGDEIIAAAGVRMRTEGELSQILGRARSAPLLVVARAGALRNIRLPQIAEPRVKVTVAIDEAADEPRVALRNGWMGGR